MTSKRKFVGEEDDEEIEILSCKTVIEVVPFSREIKSPFHWELNDLDKVSYFTQNLQEFLKNRKLKVNKNSLNTFIQKSCNPEKGISPTSDEWMTFWRRCRLCPNLIRYNVSNVAQLKKLLFPEKEETITCIGIVENWCYFLHENPKKEDTFCCAPKEIVNKLWEGNWKKVKWLPCCTLPKLGSHSISYYLGSGFWIS
jgi:hypothetical protein